MSGKDLAGEAAIDALRSVLGDAVGIGSMRQASQVVGSNEDEKAADMSSDKQDSEFVKIYRDEPRLPSAGSAEAELQRLADAEAAKKTAASAAPTATSSAAHDRLPEKGSAEAEAHRLAAREAARQDAGQTANSRKAAAGGDGNISFLLTALLLPLLIVGGIYGYAAYQDRGQGTATSAPAKTDRLAQGPAATGMEQVATPREQSTGMSGMAASGATEKAKTQTTPATTAPATPAPAAAAAPATGSEPAAAHGATEAPAQHAAWGYEGAAGPAAWGALDPAYKTCSIGQLQSPIDVPLTRGQPGPRFEYVYQPTAGDVVNNGHTILVKPAGGNQLLVNGSAYELENIHFHTPSEHLIGGHSFPMEIHLVHRNTAGQRAVVAVMVEDGGLNPVLERLPAPHPGAAPLALDRNPLDLAQMLPESKGYFTFAGSLTTPPCNENVGWIVLSQPIKVPRASIDRFKQVLKANNRPVQPLNGRVIYSSN